MKPTILVTGGAGYIGSHVVLGLQQSGYNVLIYDNFSEGHRDLAEQVLRTDIIIGDTRDRDALDRVFARYNIAAVMHFAASIAVGESVEQPGPYYQNNVTGTLTLLEAMANAQVQPFVFSSTCAIYGPPQMPLITEEHPKNPISPYARSKWIVEQMLPDLEAAYGLRSVAFRYFNAAGADPQGRLGEDHQPETHLIPLILQAAMGKRDAIRIYGTDYDTPDGTCIRDYIHVCDLAKAHVLGLQHLIAGGPSLALNLGNSRGYSVREVIDLAKEVTGRPIQVVAEERRAGDPAVLVGSYRKAQELLGWVPDYPDLRDILSHAWTWHQQRHGTHPSEISAPTEGETPTVLSSSVTPSVTTLAAK